MPRSSRGHAPSSPVEIPVALQRVPGPLSAAGCIHSGSGTGTVPLEAKAAALHPAPWYSWEPRSLVFSPVSPSCLREHLYLFWHLSVSIISPFPSHLQSAPERADTDAEHPQPALPPCRAGGTLPLELPGSRYGSCPVVPVAPWRRAGTCIH